MFEKDFFDNNSLVKDCLNGGYLKIKFHDFSDLFRTNFGSMSNAGKYGFTIQIGVNLALLSNQMHMFIFALCTKEKHYPTCTAGST